MHCLESAVPLLIPVQAPTGTHTQRRRRRARRFKARKGGAGGDVKGSSRVEPYAYWPLDRKLLNRRADKKAAAEQGLQAVVRSAGRAGKGEGRAKRRRVQG